MILKRNPNRLNFFGVLAIPGLLAIRISGLTPDMATKRVGADSDLHQFGDDARKLVGYDLLEGDSSAFAPVADIQVPIDTPWDRPIP